MEGNIPVPAESLRTIAQGAVDEARRQRAAGRRDLAEELEEKAGTALRALDGKDGEFVSIQHTVLSTLCAYSGDSDNIWQHRRAARVFLEQYGIWGQ